MAALVFFGGLLYLFGERGAGEREEESLCGGYLSFADVSKIGGGEERGYESSLVNVQEDLSGYRGSSSGEDGVISRCGIWLGMQNLAEVEVFAAWEFGPYQGRRVPPDWYVEEAPLGSGLAGWTDEGRADVWLPEKCSTVFKSDGVPIQVQLELKNPRDGYQHDSGRTRRLMAEVLTSYAENLAKERGCDSAEFGVVEEVPEVSVVEDLPVDGHCGLSGFEVLRVDSSREFIRQRTVGDIEGDWSCVLTRDGEEGVYALSAFAVTSNKQIISRYKSSSEEPSEYFHADLLSCGSGEYLVQTAHAGVDRENHSENDKKSHEYAEADLLAAGDLHSRFFEAFQKSLRCSS
ncbi:hypothetical protein [Streptomyces barkulensis]|uniref:hypothetical protein n=1 Tax=Streptomyces barkulensis TaxID=1257026 RepID=UPI00117CFBC4|nr:hypothetical protein [Streptomyces barkulensis]